MQVPPMYACRLERADGEHADKEPQQHEADRILLRLRHRDIDAPKGNSRADGAGQKIHPHRLAMIDLSYVDNSHRKHNLST